MLNRIPVPLLKDPQHIFHSDIDTLLEVLSARPRRTCLHAPCPLLNTAKSSGMNLARTTCQATTSCIKTYPQQPLKLIENHFLRDFNWNDYKISYVYNFVGYPNGRQAIQTSKMQQEAMPTRQPESTTRLRLPFRLLQLQYHTHPTSSSSPVSCPSKTNDIDTTPQYVW